MTVIMTAIVVIIVIVKVELCHLPGSGGAPMIIFIHENGV